MIPAANKFKNVCNEDICLYIEIKTVENLSKKIRLDQVES
jgi:hypothetical protein